MVTFTSILAIMKEAGVRGPGCGRGELSIGHACKDGWLVVVTVVQKVQTTDPTKEVDLIMGESAVNSNPNQLLTVFLLFLITSTYLVLSKYLLS